MRRRLILAGLAIAAPVGVALAQLRGMFVDLRGAHSPEYFARVSNDGRWLVWGAAASGDEHDRADHDTFIWPMASGRWAAR